MSPLNEMVVGVGAGALTAEVARTQQRKGNGAHMHRTMMTRPRSLAVAVGVLLGSKVLDDQEQLSGLMVSTS